MIEDKVSIIVPTYNSKEDLGKCLHSLLEQDYNNIEIIVLNDGSNDGTDEVLEKFVKDNIIIINKSNEGVSKTRNKGMEIATGKYVVFVDSDDVVEKNFISSLVKLQLINKEALVGCCVQKIVDGDYIKIYQKNKYTCEEFIDSLIKGKIDGFIVRYLFNKEMLEELTFYPNITYMEDTVFLLEYILKNKVKNIVFNEEYNYYYIQTRYSKTNNPNNVLNNLKSIHDSINLMIKVLKQYNVNIKCNECLINKEAKLLEHNIAKIYDRIVYDTFKSDNEIKRNIKSIMHQKGLKKVWRGYFIFIYKVPYFVFKLYIIIRTLIVKIKKWCIK